MGDLVDPQKQASAFFLDYNLVIPALPAAKSEWKYGLKDMGIEHIKVCPKTFRPFYYVGGKTWMEAAEE